MNIEIRKATETDLPTIFALIKEFATYLGKSTHVKTSLEDFKREYSLFDCLLAETEDGVAVGYALFCFTFHTWSGKSIYLDDLYIKEEYRRCQIGSKLVHSLIDYAKQHRCKNINWQVLDWNEKAISFYKKMGVTVGDDNLNCSFPIKF
ncbi:MAG: hypothetical protein RL662_1954 [Bacteroidota bacterium]|jgi:GNAT superfamily N-acetyltransferase